MQPKITELNAAKNVEQKITEHHKVVDDATKLNTQKAAHNPKLDIAPKKVEHSTK